MLLCMKENFRFLTTEMCKSASKADPFQLGHPPLYVTFSICLFVCLSIHPSICLSVCCAPYLRNRTSSDHNLWYMCKMMIPPGVFFFPLFFVNFDFLGRLGSKRAKNSLKRKNKNYTCHRQYLRNSIEYDRGFWYTRIK